MASSEQSKPEGAYPYTEVEPQRVGEREVLDELYKNHNKDLVARNLEEIVETEGPIEAGRLVRLLASRFNLFRVRQNRQGPILALAPERVERSKIFGDFYWPKNADPESYRGYRPRIDSGLIPVGEIAHREIANAMRAILNEQGGLMYEEFIREVAGVFGYMRLGSAIKQRLNDVIEWAQSQGILAVDENDIYRLSENREGKGL